MIRLLALVIVLGTLYFFAPEPQADARTLNLPGGWSFVTFRPDDGHDRQIGSIDVQGIRLFAAFDNKTKAWSLIDVDAPTSLWGFTIFKDGQPYVVWVDGPQEDGRTYGYWIQ